MSEFTLERDNNVPLTFTGVLLAQRSSRKTGASRWTDVSIYRTNKRLYVVHTTGRSTNPTESDRNTVFVSNTPAAIRKSLTRYGDDGPYLTNVALQTLRAAAEKDDALTACLEEHI